LLQSTITPHNVNCCTVLYRRSRGHHRNRLRIRVLSRDLSSIE
jgi:hypothetical protein